MRIRGMATALMAVAALATGCGGVVAGVAKPAPNLKPGPLSGATVKQVLLDGATLSRMLNRDLCGAGSGRIRWARKALSGSALSTSQTGCLGVTAMLQQGVYRSADVKDVASESVVE